MTTVDTTPSERWSVRIDPWWRDFDDLGHITAASYAIIYEEAFGHFMVDVWQNPDPSYVVGRLSIEYLHEVRRADLPLFVFVVAERVGRASVTIRMEMRTQSGKVHSVASAKYVGWNRAERTSRVFTESEREALLVHFDPATAVTP